MLKKTPANDSKKDQVKHNKAPEDTVKHNTNAHKNEPVHTHIEDQKEEHTHKMRPPAQTTTQTAITYEESIHLSQNKSSKKTESPKHKLRADSIERYTYEEWDKKHKEIWDKSLKKENLKGCEVKAIIKQVTQATSTNSSVQNMQNVSQNTNQNVNQKMSKQEEYYYQQQNLYAKQQIPQYGYPKVKEDKTQVDTGFPQNYGYPYNQYGPYFPPQYYMGQNQEQQYGSFMQPMINPYYYKQFQDIEQDNLKPKQQFNKPMMDYRYMQPQTYMQDMQGLDQTGQDTQSNFQNINYK